MIPVWMNLTVTSTSEIQMVNYTILNSHPCLAIDLEIENRTYIS